jgi:TolB protein
MMNADGSDRIPLTNNPAANDNNSDARWSPDDMQIIFYSNRDGNGEIYVMNADGSDQMRLTDNPAGDGAPDWSA